MPGYIDAQTQTEKVVIHGGETKVCGTYHLYTPEALYNTVRYNTVLDITRIRVGPQMAIKDTFSYIIYAFYSRYNTDWIANTEIGLDPNNSVIKRSWCTCHSKFDCTKNRSHYGF